MTVALLSWKNGEAFRQQLNLQYQRTSLDTGENVGQAIEGLLKNWQSQLGLLVQTIVTQPSANQELTIKNFLLGDDDFLAVHFYKLDGDKLELQKFVKTDKISANFETESPTKIFHEIEKNIPLTLTDDIKSNANESAYVTSHIREIGLPIMSFARSYKLKGSQATYWMVLTAWQESILSHLKFRDSMKSVVLDRHFKIFASKDRADMKGKDSYENLEIVKMAQNSVVREGFLGGYRDSQGTEWLGAYYRINKFGLIVLVQQDAESAYAAIRNLINQTLKWGLFFLLIAIFFSYFGSTGITKNLRDVTMATQHIAAGHFKAFLRPKSNDEVGILSQSVNAMAYHIQQLLLSQIQKARVEKELETATAVQHTLFPKASRSRLFLDIAGFSTPASECGGDWWGHFTTEDGVEYVFIADAMGHGVPAALVTAMAYSSCMTLIAMIQENQINDHSPKAFLEKFNTVLYDAVEGKISMSFFALVVDYRRNKLIFANAGHNQPILIPADPNDPRCGKKVKKWQEISPLTPVTMKAAGTVLGVQRDATFTEHELDLKPGDKVVLYTDGLIECQSPQGRTWGRKVLIEKLLKYVDKTPSQIKKGLIDEAFAFFGNQPLNDDLTLVVIEYPKEAAGKFKPAEEVQHDDGSIKIDLGA
jgi:serine phosphatase RsbU (regulator of sigma subunit)